jgi:hypothetical protein
VKSASLSELKKELSTKPHKEVLELCMRIAKYKKDNKELLNYLLFEAGNETVYIAGIKEETDLQFSEMNRSNIYFSKKSIRKILRILNKYIRYSGNRQTEVELLMYFCTKIQKSGIPYQKSIALSNLYQRQIQKIQKALSLLHEDLQYDYGEELKLLLR